MNSQEILDFWFQELEPKDWFNGGDRVDDLIRERFEQGIEKVYHGDLADWLSTPKGRLASIITLDQFPRNIYRRTPRSFGYDDKAVEWCLEGIEKGIDTELKPIERVFYYLPLEHSEKMEHQDLSLERFAHIVTTVKPEERQKFREFLHYAWRHYEIIKRFGRYPHRNDILGRESSDKEKNFLGQPGSSFL